MRRKNVQARLLRALSGKTQEQTAEETGVTPALIAQIELGKNEPGAETLAGIAGTAELTVADAEEILRHAETLQRSRLWQGPGAEAVLHELAERLRSHLARAWRRLSTLQLPEPVPTPKDRHWARELRERLERLLAESRPAAGQDAGELQRWLLCAAVCEQSVREASRDRNRASALARLAREIAEPARLPEGARLQGYAAAFEANILRVSDELKAAEIGFLEAQRMWESGSDPFGVLDPGRVPDLEASLRREQRRFAEALELLDQAVAVGRSPERSRVKKATTLLVMGEYEPAIEALLAAAPKIDPQGEPRLMNVLLFDLAVLFCHVGRHAEAAELVPRVRALASELGDEFDLIRLIWLEGRVAAGQGRAEEARRLLAQARQEFAARGMAYDVALTLLEEAVTLLEEGRAAEVKALAGELTQVFAEKGVHREALAALRLFRRAIEREEVTAELGRRVLRFLFRARHDEGLRFKP
jgi:transcriptional regulator with XRE-family HTH domain